MTEPQKAERDAFENWLIREKGHFTEAIERMRDGDRYWHEPIQRLWEAWQAAFEAGRSAREQDLRSALGRVLQNFKSLLARKPVRDASETIAEAEFALKEHP